MRDAFISSELVRGTPILDPIPVLLVSSRTDDHELFPDLLKSAECVIFHAFTCADAAGILQQYPFPAVVTDQTLSDGNWTDIQSARGPSVVLPNVIVLCPPGSPQFWAEALTNGAFDVLCRPLGEPAATCAVKTAYLRWSRAAERISAREENIRAIAQLDHDRSQSPRIAAA